MRGVKGVERGRETWVVFFWCVSHAFCMTWVHITQGLTRGKKGSAYRHRSQTVVAAAAAAVVVAVAGKQEGRSRPWLKKRGVIRGD